MSFFFVAMCRRSIDGSQVGSIAIRHAASPQLKELEGGPGGWALGSLAPSCLPDQIKQAKRSLLNPQGQPPPLTSSPAGMSTAAKAVDSTWAFGTGPYITCCTRGAVKGDDRPLTRAYGGCSWSATRTNSVSLRKMSVLQNFMHVEIHLSTQRHHRRTMVRHDEETRVRVLKIFRPAGARSAAPIRAVPSPSLRGRRRSWRRPTRDGRRRSAMARCICCATRRYAG